MPAPDGEQGRLTGTEIGVECVIERDVAGIVQEEVEIDLDCARPLDRTISLDVQRRMHRALGMTGVVTLPSAHSPFLSMPGELARSLVAIGTA